MPFWESQAMYRTYQEELVIRKQRAISNPRYQRYPGTKNHQRIINLLPGKCSRAKLQWLLEAMSQTHCHQISSTWTTARASTKLLWTSYVSVSGVMDHWI